MKNAPHFAYSIACTRDTDIVSYRPYRCLVRSPMRTFRSHPELPVSRMYQRPHQPPLSQCRCWDTRKLAAGNGREIGRGKELGRNAWRYRHLPGGGGISPPSCCRYHPPPPINLTCATQREHKEGWIVPYELFPITSTSSLRQSTFR